MKTERHRGTGIKKVDRPPPTCRWCGKSIENETTKQTNKGRAAVYCSPLCGTRMRRMMRENDG